MIKRKTRYHILVGALVALVVVTAGSLIGSNMGFKATRDYDEVAGVTTMYGLALPHHNPWEPGINDSDAFLFDMWDPVAKVPFSIRYWNNGINNWRERLIQDTKLGPAVGGNEPAPFEFIVGEGYMLRMPPGTNLKARTLVGSHDPTFDWSTYPPMVEIAGVTGMYGIAITPNTKWVTSDDVLFAWWDAGAKASFSIRYWNNTINNWRERVIQDTKLGPAVGGNEPVPFPLQPFEGYMIRPVTTGSQVFPTAGPYY